MRGHLGIKLHGNREIAGDWAVGIGTVDSGFKWAQSWNQIKTLKDCHYCHCYCAQLGTPWDAVVVACRAISNRESWYPRRDSSSRERETHGMHTIEGTVFEKVWTCSEQVFEEMVVNRFWTVTGIQEPRRAAGVLHRWRFFLERSDNVIARRTRCLRDFSASVLLDTESDPPKRGVYVTFVWRWIFLRPCERVCLWINIYFSKHQKKQWF